MATMTADQAVALATDYLKAGRLAECDALCKLMLASAPGQPDALHLLGVLAGRSGDSQNAARFIRRAIDANPTNAEFHCNLGSALYFGGHKADAIAAYREALRLNPALPEALNNLGNALHATEQIEEAIECYRAAIALRPDYHEAHANLGISLKETGRLDEAIESFRQSLRIKPDFVVGLFLSLHYHPGITPQARFEEHRRWDAENARPLQRFLAPHENSPDRYRRLRIGYVSPDFRNHPVGRFIRPLLENHDPDAVEIYCYSNSAESDAVTAELRSHARVWRPIHGLADEAVAWMIREDRIDVLVDLAMHTAHNRLLVFARRAAPVQVTFLAYCSTTGMDAMQYRLSDPYLDPPGADESCYSERTVRLPETYWCYPGEPEAPAVNALPADSGRGVTFGCLNKFAKVSPRALQLWAGLLTIVSGSRLLLHTREGKHREGIREIFAGEGVDATRLEFAGFVPHAEYFRQFQAIDIGLDTFPCTGGTTTCDALWMGVPVVTLAGTTAISRGGVSILSNVGLPELIAFNEADYVRIAVELAGDVARLRDLRKTMRDRMRGSPLMDAPRYARGIEKAYRGMWQTWCAEQKAARKRK